ncbi:MAG: hypothetical protein KA347_07915, partial [Bacteroidia bacterium]|nr:hypothetical protein [Bacteroidia bacterium]
GNVSVNGNNVTFNTSGGTLKFAGEQNQEFGGGSNTLTFNKLIVDKAGGSVTLNQPITIDSLLQLISGIIYTDTIITLKATATTAGASNQSFVDGTVKKIGNTAFVFPVGDEGHHYPLEISAPSNSTDAFSVNYKNEFHNESDSADTSLTYISRCQFWNIKRLTGSSNVSVKLYWDSLGCGVYDTSGLVLTSWNGTKWIDNGCTSISGNAKFGSLWSSSTLTSFLKVTLASKQPAVPTQPTRVTALERTIPEDIFGYNGSNTFASDVAGNPLQSWEILNSLDNNISNDKKFFSDKHVTLMRIPAGTLSNFSDWRTNYPLIERDLPFNWFYDKNAYKLPMNRQGNSYDHLKLNLEKVACRPIIAMNMLTSKYFQELAAFYSLNENNLPLSYIELGNEFYLNDEYYKEIFPSVNDYMDMAQQWASDIKDIPNFQNTEIAIVGAISKDNNHGRQRSWLDQVLERLKVANDVDAITLHDYINEGKASDPCGGDLMASGIEHFLLQPFEHISELQAKELLKIQQFNASFSPKEIWITEFNLDDDNDNRTGTWAHGLLGAALALKYLETPEITKIISHTMLSGAKFGNIFESDIAFDEVGCHGDLNGNLTRIAEKTALGTALDGVAYVMRHAVDATPLDFPGAQDLDGNANYAEIYGWTFEDANGFLKTIILNLSSNRYEVDVQGIYTGLTSANLNAVVVNMTDDENNYVIIGDGAELPTTHELFINNNPWKFNSVNIVEMPLLSMLIIDQNIDGNSIRNVRLTDNEICSGSSTTLVIESNESLTGELPTCSTCPLTFTLVENIGNRWIYSAVAGNVSSTQLYNIDPCSACTPIDIIVHQDISNLVLNASSTVFCPTTTPLTAITLTASFDEGAGGDNTLGYSFLWTPDSGIVSNLCSSSPSPMCWSIDVEPKRTTTYGVYVTDGQCWSHDEVEIVVPVHPFTLGDDITVCTNTTINLTPNYSPLDANTSTVATYLWSDNSTTENMQIIPSTAGTFEYILTITDDNCTREDTIIVNVISCCSSAPSVHIKPIEMFIPNTNQIRNEYYNHVGNLPAAINMTSCSSCAVSFLGGVNNRRVLTIDGAGTSTIFIDGEFRIPYDINTDDTNPLELDGMDLTLRNLTLSMGENAWINVMSGQRLVLENCSITTCGSNMWRGIVLDKRGDRKSPEIEFISPNFIENAETAVYLTRESIFNIEGVTFNNCFVDLEIVNQKGNSNTNTIFGCNFTSSGAGLIAPHLGERKFAGIVLDDVDLVNIGINSTDVDDANTFAESIYGIKSKNSSIRLLKSNFHDIWENSTSTRGVCLYSESDFDFTDRSIQVGNGSSDAQNNFSRSISGIVGFGEMTYSIRNNQFGINDVAEDRLVRQGIAISTNGNKDITISNGNSFRQYNNGILISRPGGKGTVLIDNNDFFQAFINSSNFTGTAINFFTVHPTKMLDATISNNTIGTEAGTDQARIGIRLSMLDRVIIENNHIHFHLGAVPSENYRGIWSQVCKNIKIQNVNEVTNQSGLVSNITNSLIGIRMDMSYGSCIEENTLENLGYGMSFSGNSLVYSLFQNQFINYNEGIRLVVADIGAKQGYEFPVNSGTGNFLNNTWTSTANDLNRIEGDLMYSTGIDWYTNTSNSVDDEYPSSVLNPLIKAFELTSPTSNSQCPDFEEIDVPPITARIRNDLFGGIVNDTARYEETYYNQFRYLARQAVYQTLKEFPELLEMDDEADDDFQEFYQSLNSSNINKIDSVETLFSENKLDEAAALLSNFEDTNDIESNYKYVYLAYLNYIANGDSVLSPSDSSILLEIANLNSLTDGKAVFVARNMLNLEIEDELSSSLRMQQIKNSSKKEEPSKLKVFPNPASVSVHVEISNGVIPERTDFYDLAGRVCFTHFGPGDINVSKLQAGFYLLKAEANGMSYFGNLILKRL